MFQTLKSSFITVAVLANLSLPLAAQEPSTLQVTGADGATVTFSMADLDALDQVTITTTTIWTEGELTFTGPSLQSILSMAEIESPILTLTALNDYAIEMPAPEVDAIYPILATRMDGEPMSVRDKGPFWIVFPYDSDPAFQTETVYSQSIWQLDRIDVLD